MSDHYDNDNGLEMVEMPSGAKRSKMMLRYDLIPRIAKMRLAERFTGHTLPDGTPDGGALKYGENNWKKGLPTSDVINHILEHLDNYIDALQEAVVLHGGNMDEVALVMREHAKLDDDLAGAMWGISVLMWQEEHGKMLRDERFKP